MNIHSFSEFGYKQFTVKVTKVQCQGKNNETSLRHFNVSTQTKKKSMNTGLCGCNYGVINHYINITLSPAEAGDLYV